MTANPAHPQPINAPRSPASLALALTDPVALARRDARVFESIAHEALLDADACAALLRLIAGSPERAVAPARLQQLVAQADAEGAFGLLGNDLVDALWDPRALAAVAISLHPARVREFTALVNASAALHTPASGTARPSLVAPSAQPVAPMVAPGQAQPPMPPTPARRRAARRAARGNVVSMRERSSTTPIVAVAAVLLVAATLVIALMIAPTSGPSGNGGIAETNNATIVPVDEDNADGNDAVHVPSIGNNRGTNNSDRPNDPLANAHVDRDPPINNGDPFIPNTNRNDTGNTDVTPPNNAGNAPVNNAGDSNGADNSNSASNNNGASNNNSAGNNSTDPNTAPPSNDDPIPPLPREPRRAVLVARDVDGRATVTRALADGTRREEALEPGAVLFADDEFDVRRGPVTFACLTATVGAEAFTTEEQVQLLPAHADALAADAWARVMMDTGAIVAIARPVNADAISALELRDGEVFVDATIPIHHAAAPRDWSLTIALGDYAFTVDRSQDTAEPFAGVIERTRSRAVVTILTGGVLATLGGTTLGGIARATLSLDDGEVRVDRATPGARVALPSWVARQGPVESIVFESAFESDALGAMPEPWQDAGRVEAPHQPVQGVGERVLALGPLNDMLGTTCEFGEIHQTDRHVPAYSGLAVRARIWVEAACTLTIHLYVRARTENFSVDLRLAPGWHSLELPLEQFKGRVSGDDVGPGMRFENLAIFATPEAERVEIDQLTIVRQLR